MPRIKTILAQSSPWSNTVTLSASHTHTHKSVDLVCMIQTDSLVTGMLVRQPTGHSNRVRKSCPHTLFRALRCPTLSTSQISPVAAPSSHPASLVGQTLTGCRCSTTGSRIVEVSQSFLLLFWNKNSIRIIGFFIRMSLILALFLLRKYSPVVVHR